MGKEPNCTEKEPYTFTNLDKKHKMLARLIKPNGALAHASKQFFVRQPYRCLSYNNSSSISSLTNRNPIYLSKPLFLNNNITVRQLHTSNDRRNDDKKKKDDDKKESKKPE